MPTMPAISSCGRLSRAVCHAGVTIAEVGRCCKRRKEAAYKPWGAAYNGPLGRKPAKRCWGRSAYPVRLQQRGALRALREWQRWTSEMKQSGC